MERGHSSLIMHLSVRELQHSDIAHIVRYWLESGDAHMRGMGVDLEKMPNQEAWTQMLNAQLKAPLHEKQAYCMVWLMDNKPVGHCNINMIQQGVEAHMDLHLWHADSRKKGAGTQFVKLTLPHFFKAYDLQRIICQPYARNPAANKTLEKVGFTFVKEYLAIPGFLNFEQPVKQWVFEVDRLSQLDK